MTFIFLSFCQDQSHENTMMIDHQCFVFSSFKTLPFFKVCSAECLGRHRFHEEIGFDV